MGEREQRVNGRSRKQEIIGFEKDNRLETDLVNDNMYYLDS